MFAPILQKCNLDGLEQTFHPFRDNIFESKTKQVNDVKFYHFTISFNGFLEHYNVSIHDAPPHSLKDSNANPKVETTKEEKVRVCSLARNILGVKGRVRALG
jgi:hypothetical protein